MIFSDPFAMKYKRQDATLYVIRQNGACWGRLVLRDGTEYDVSTRHDYYDDADETAAEAFARKARRKGGVEEPQGWLGQEFMPPVHCEYEV